MTLCENNRRVLIVDDMESIHKDIRAILTYSNADDRFDTLAWEVLGTRSDHTASIEYEIDSAYQGQDGLELVMKALDENRPYALAIVDVRMPPGWDGVETVRRIREVDPQIQIAICTAYSDYSWQSMHELFGTNDWLLLFKKPFDLAEVQQFCCALTEKWNLAKNASLRIEDLKRLVDEHATKLCSANAQLEERNMSLAEANEKLSREYAARCEADAKIRHIAFHDTLTDLPNRASLMERLNLCIERSKRQRDYLFAVLFTDIDDFKLVNDSLGHHVGDQLLSQIAVEMVRSMRTLDASLRPAHDTVARLGGDEFVILLDDARSTDIALRVAQRVQQRVCRSISLEHRTLVPSMSIGVAVSRNYYDDPADIMRDADTALYHAKGEGKGRVALFDQDMHARVLDRLNLENDLTRAIEENEFVVYYQPIVSLRSGKVDCVEALVRWRHPTRGLLDPDTFLPVAEHTGVIDVISEHVLNEVTAQVNKWRTNTSHAANMSVSVNLSACQLVDSGLVTYIDQSLKQYDLPASALKLELTESMMMRNLTKSQETIDRLVARGIDVYLDDFGTGYSSLSMLHTLPFAAIKLDRGFVQHLADEADCQTTVQAMVMMANNRGMTLIAEGVETYEHVAILKALECEYAQGFYFARPGPAKHMDTLFVDEARYCLEERLAEDAALA